MSDIERPSFLRGAPAVRIATPCPACGSRSLFLGSGGHLTCAVLGCSNPSPEAVVRDLRGALAKSLDVLVAVAALPAAPGYLWADNATLAEAIREARSRLGLEPPPNPLAERVRRTA